MIKFFTTLILLFLTFQGIGQTKIPLIEKNGIYTIPCKINGKETTFYFDSGATDVSLSFEYFKECYDKGYFKDYDILPEIIDYKLANGSVTQAQKINIKELKIGDLILRNVIASVSLNLDAPMLLGQSALRRLGKYTFDYESNLLTISNTNSNEIPFSKYEKNRKIRIEQMGSIDGMSIQCESHMKMIKSSMEAMENIIIEGYRVNIRTNSNGDKALNIEYDITNNSNVSKFIFSFMKAEVITTDGRTYVKKKSIKDLEVGATSSDGRISINIRDREPKFLRFSTFFDSESANQILDGFCKKYK